MTQSVAVVPLGGAVYSATVAALALAVTATDFATLSGAAGKIITLNRIAISGVATAATSATLLLIKRTTLDTGGTATNPAGVLIDSGQSAEAARAVMAAYTANPAALGTATAPLGGTLAAFTVGLGTAAAPQPQTILSGDIVGSPNIVLRNSTDQIAINANSVTIAGGLVSVTFVWTEA